MQKSPYNFRILPLLLTTGLLLAGPASADEVTDLIQQAVAQYQEGKFRQAAESLDYAAQMVRQKRSAGLEQFLPQPLKGWSGDAATTEAVAGAMMGGMTTAQRRYHKGASNIEIRLAADSPLLQGMMMMFSSPMLASAQGGKLTTIGGEKAIVKYDPASRSGDVNIMTGNGMMVTVNGNEVEKQDLLEYATGVDFEGLRGF